MAGVAVEMVWLERRDLPERAGGEGGGEVMAWAEPPTPALNAIDRD